MSGAAGRSFHGAPVLFLVCEDGDEYTQRFERFLGHEFRFLRVASGTAAKEELARQPVAAILLDLDFRRAAADSLLREAAAPTVPPTAEEQARTSAVQGILILQHLRREGIAVPALLFADLDDGDQIAYLEGTLAPLAIVSSREGLAQLAARLRGYAAKDQSPLPGNGAASIS